MVEIKIREGEVRILGFSQKDWMNYLTGKPKLQEKMFTTFRFTRRDKDWGINEIVQIVFKPRTKMREVLGVAEITDKVTRRLTATVHLGTLITADEAKADGFENLNTMFYWMHKIHGSRLWKEPMNKFTLRWIKRA